MELEPESSEQEGFSERLIPEIPGVLPNYEDDNTGDLNDDVDEESDEDLIEGVAKEVKTLLTKFGIRGMNNARQPDIVRLWERMIMDNHLITDLALFSMIDAQKVFRDELKIPSFNDLFERSEADENPYDVRIRLIEEVAPGLQKIGYSELKAYRLLNGPNEELATAFKALGWLTGLSFMSDLPQRLNAERAASEDHKLKRSKIFEITLDEIVRQARVIESEEAHSTYDLRLNSHLEARDRLKETMRNAYRIAEYAFTKYLPQ